MIGAAAGVVVVFLATFIYGIGAAPYEQRRQLRSKLEKSGTPHIRLTAATRTAPKPMSMTGEWISCIDIAVVNESEDSGGTSARDVWVSTTVTTEDGTSIFEDLAMRWSGTQGMKIDELPPNGFQTDLQAISKDIDEAQCRFPTAKYSQPVSGSPILLMVTVHATNLIELPTKRFRICNAGKGAKLTITDA